MSIKIWLTLVVLTLLTFCIGYFELINSFIIGVILLTILIKGQLIIDYFMGLKDVSLTYRSIPMLWLLVVVLLIALAYFLPLNE